jgi:hypothetical protein
VGPSHSIKTDANPPPLPPPASLLPRCLLLAVLLMMMMMLRAPDSPNYNAKPNFGSSCLAIFILAVMRPAPT